jgi:hypothetical protein
MGTQQNLGLISTKFMDAYSLLHFAVGVVVRHWDMSLIVWFILHTIFEIVENTSAGMYFINKYITIWPGGKDYADSPINSIGDTVFSILGWYLADYTLKI